MKPADVRAKVFGDARYTESFVVQAWHQGPSGPVVWREKHARTVAGARRISKSRGLVAGLRGPAIINTYHITEWESVVQDG